MPSQTSDLRCRAVAGQPTDQLTPAMGHALVVHPPGCPKLRVRDIDRRHVELAHGGGAQADGLDRAPRRCHRRDPVANLKRSSMMMKIPRSGSEQILRASATARRPARSRPGSGRPDTPDIQQRRGASAKTMICATAIATPSIEVFRWGERSSTRRRIRSTTAQNSADITSERQVTTDVLHAVVCSTASLTTISPISGARSAPVRGTLTMAASRPGAVVAHGALASDRKSVATGRRTISATSMIASARTVRLMRHHVAMFPKRQRLRVRLLNVPLPSCPFGERPFIALFAAISLMRTATVKGGRARRAAHVTFARGGWDGGRRIEPQPKAL